MKKLGLFLVAVMLLSFVQSASAATAVRSSKLYKTEYDTHASTVYTVQLKAFNRNQNSANYSYNYVYFQGDAFNSDSQRLLRDTLQEVYTNLLPAVSSENIIAGSVYANDQNFVARVNKTTTSFSNPLEVLKNQSICPGRSWRVTTDNSGQNGDLVNESNIEEYLEKNTDTHYWQLGAETTTSEGYDEDGNPITIETTKISKHDVTIREAILSKYISPIVLDLKGDGVLEASKGNYMPHNSMDKSNVIVTDFYGDGFEIAMEWVGPNDGLLVAPKADGSVDMSCLFGVANGFDSGYERLSLYADKNGVVKGDALNKLAVWRDANRNGIAESSEVTSCRDLGITSINARNNNFVSSFQMNGKTHTMWDWWPTAQELRTISLK